MRTDLVTFPALLLLAACTPRAEIDQACASHPPRLPAAPVAADGYYLADYRVPRPAVDWAAGELLGRGFDFVETEGRAFGVAAPYVRVTRTRDAGACAAGGVLAPLPPLERDRAGARLIALGLLPGECLAATPRAAPGARYRVTIDDHSPPRRPWLDGLTGRRDVRVQTRLVDSTGPLVLGEVWSVTLSYQITVSGSPVTGCGRHAELRQLLAALAPATPRAAAPAAVAEAPPADFARRRDAPLEVVSTTAGGAPIHWKEEVRLKARLPAPPRDVSVALVKNGWQLTLPRDKGWLRVPLPWMAREANAGYADQPVRVLASPRGIGILAVWRQVSSGAPPVFALAYAEYSASGKPLSLARAALPLAPGVNPFDVILGVPAWHDGALQFTATEQGPRDDTRGLAASVRPVVRETRYRWPAAG